MCDQLKRASVSVLANIAEGYQRTPKLYRHYLYIASGSSNEMVALLQVAQKVHHSNTQELQSKYKHLGKQILAFSKTLKPKKITNN